MTQPDNVVQFLKNLKFSAVAPPEGRKRRLFIGSHGPQGSGKTRFITTMPGPIAVIDFDRGMEGVAEYDIFGNPIFRRSIEMPDFEDKTTPDKAGNSAPAATQSEIELAKRSVVELKDTFEKLLKSGLIRSIVIDNGGSAYNLLMAARFGQIARLGEVPSQMWRLMQQEFENMFNPVYDHTVNCYVSHREKRKYQGVAGELTLDGYEKMMNVVQVHLQFQKANIITPAPPGSGQKPTSQVKLSAKVVKCRQNFGLEGEEFDVEFLDEEMTQSVGLDFLTVATSVFPNTAEGDWF